MKIVKRCVKSKQINYYKGSNQCVWVNFILIDTITFDNSWHRTTIVSVNKLLLYPTLAYHYYRILYYYSLFFVYNRLFQALPQQRVQAQQPMRTLRFWHIADAIYINNVNEAQSYITVVTTLLHVEDLNWDNNIAMKKYRSEMYRPS